MAGGFEIPVGILAGFNNHADYVKLKSEVFETQIKQKFLRLINPDHQVIHS